MNLIEFKQKNAGVSVKPILFSTEMVKAILQGRKTQTRRVVKPQPSDKINWDSFGISALTPKGHIEGRAQFEDGYGSKFFKCPYKPGDILWVRETWATSGFYPITEFKVWYAADVCSKKYDKPDGGWNPSIHMPFIAARIFLRIKSVIVQRLKDIPPMDAGAEGIEIVSTEGITGMYWRNYLSKDLRCMTATESFNTLWKSINGPESWDANPWVWVVEFERIDINK